MDMLIIEDIIIKDTIEDMLEVIIEDILERVIRDTPEVKNYL
jgi:hypothetical protein